MDLNFTKEELAFRDEVRTFFKENGNVISTRLSSRNSQRSSMVARPRAVIVQ